MADYKVLITGPSWIGDMVMAQSLFKYLHESIPGVAIDVLAPEWTLPVVRRMPEIRNGIPFHSRHGHLDLMMRVKTGLKLRKESYDEAMVIPRSLKSTIPSLIAGIKKRTALKSHFGLINNPRKYEKSREYLFVRRILTLAMDDAYRIPPSDIPGPKLTVDDEHLDLLVKQFGLSVHQYVIFAPGAEFGPAKQWPTGHFAELAELLEHKGLQVVILGASKESPIAQTIVGQSVAKNILDLTGLTSLPDVVDLMSGAHTVVANDSGLMHLAYASGARVVAIYGSSSSKYTPPLSDSAVIMENELDCHPCFDRTCQYGHYDCLQSIAVKKVSEIIAA